MEEEAPDVGAAGPEPADSRPLHDSGEQPDRTRPRWDPETGGGIESLVEILQPDFTKLRGFDYPYVDRNQAGSHKT